MEPAFTYAYTLAGHEYLANEDFQRGLEAYRTALRLDPRHYNAWCAGRPRRLACFAATLQHSLAFDPVLMIHTPLGAPDGRRCGCVAPAPCSCMSSQCHDISFTRQWVCAFAIVPLTKALAASGARRQQADCEACCLSASQL